MKGQMDVEKDVVCFVFDGKGKVSEGWTSNGLLLMFCVLQIKGGPGTWGW